MKLQELKDIITKLKNDAADMEPIDELVPGLKSYLLGQESAYRNVLSFLNLVDEGDSENSVKFKMYNNVVRRLFPEQEMRCEASIDRISCNGTAIWEVRVIDLTGNVVPYRVCNKCLDLLIVGDGRIEFIPF